MEPKAAWVARVLGVTVPEATVADAEPTEAILRQELGERLRDVLGQAKALPDKTVLGQLQVLGLAAKQALDGTDLLAGELAVDALETEVARLRSDANRADAQVRKGMVKYRQAMLDWNVARGTARDNLAALAQIVRSDPEIQADPLAEEVNEIAGEFADMLPQFDDELEDLLDQLDATTAEDKRAPLLTQLAGKIDEYRAMLDGSDDLAALQGVADEEYGNMPFFSELDAALTRLKATLLV